MEGCVGCLMAVLALLLLSSFHKTGAQCLAAIGLPVVLYYVIVNLVYHARMESHKQAEQNRKEDLQRRAEQVLARCYAVPKSCWRYEQRSDGADNLQALSATTPSGGKYRLRYVWKDPSFDIQVGGWSYSVQIEDGAYRFSESCYQSWNHERGGEGGDQIAQVVVNTMLSRLGKS